MEVREYKGVEGNGIEGMESRENKGVECVGRA